MILATPLNHHIVTLCTILEPVAKDPNWHHDNICWLGMAVSFIAGRQGENAEAAYPVTVRKIIGIISEPLFNEILANPSHPAFVTDKARRLVAEKVFGELVSQAHELTLSAESEWHESSLICEQLRDVMAGLYYAVRMVALSSPQQPILTVKKALKMAEDYCI